MSNVVSGIENDLTKGYQAVDKFGQSLLDDTESVLSHPVASIRAAGVSAWDALNTGAGYVEGKLERAYDEIAGGSNLDRVSNYPDVVPHHTESQLQEIESDVEGWFTKANLKKVLKWVIVFLIVYFLGMLFVSTCKVVTGVQMGGSAFSPRVTPIGLDLSAMARF